MLTLALASLALAGPAPAKFTFDDDGDQWLRVIVWNQVWARATEFNPGTTLQGEEVDWTGDVGLRRSRVLLLGQLTPRTHVLTHFGMNNQTFNGARKPQLYMHGAWVQGDVIEKALSVGAGLHYWNGVSRMTNASTISFLALDAPILNWPTIERTDQFARQFGVFAKGKLGKFDYRVAVNRPFTVEIPLDPGGPADFSSTANTPAFAGYFMVQLMDQEGNLVPYTTGTYLGKKSVFNLGAGAYLHPDGMASLRANGNTQDDHDMLVLSGDVFVDQPVGDGAITAYGVYYHMDYGPDYVRNVGIMNIGADGTSFNGAGNAYPMMGTGEHVYTQAGYLLPVRIDQVGIQPYATAQISAMQGLDTPSTVFEVGSNWLFNGHQSKLTTQYRSRPVFEQNGNSLEQDSRASEIMAQAQVAF